MKMIRPIVLAVKGKGRACAVYAHDSQSIGSLGFIKGLRKIVGEKLAYNPKNYIHLCCEPRSPDLHILRCNILPSLEFNLKDLTSVNAGLFLTESPVKN